MENNYTMKISQNTLAVLKNFSTFNKSILVRQGNVLKTITAGKNVFARAEVEEVFPQDFAIYELSKFLGAISLFNNPDFEFFDGYLKISEGKNYIRYTYADPSLIVTPPEKEIVLPSKDIYFEISEQDLNTVQKALGVLGMPEVSIVGEDGTIYVKANNNKVPGSDQYSIAVGITDASFNMIFKGEYLKFINANYQVTVSAKGIAEFKSDAASYWVATEQNSKFGV